MNQDPSAAQPATEATPASQRDSEARASGEPIIRVQGLEKTYVTGRGPLTLFKDLDLDIAAGELVAVVGQSGAGKSTLLHILGALDAPTAGTVYCASINVGTLSPKKAATFRNGQIGYVWQFHYLLPEFSAVENVAMPLLAGGQSRRQALETAAKWLKEVGLQERQDHRPGELSGGEQQRVALARALVTSPSVLLADEPTGDLDAATSNLVFELLQRVHQKHALTSIIVTHNMELAERCDRVLRLQNGKLVEAPAGSLNAHPAPFGQNTNLQQ